jgi:hypothetical protein
VYVAEAEHWNDADALRHCMIVTARGQKFEYSVIPQSKQCSTYPFDLVL